MAVAFVGFAIEQFTFRRYRGNNMKSLQWVALHSPSFIPCDRLPVCVTFQGFTATDSNISTAETKILLTLFYSLRATGSYRLHFPSWGVSLRLALEVSWDLICFRGEGTVPSQRDFQHQPIPLSQGSHTLAPLNITILSPVGSVFFSTCLLYITSLFSI